MKIKHGGWCTLSGDLIAVAAVTMEDSSHSSMFQDLNRVPGDCVCVCVIHTHTLSLTCKLSSQSDYHFS